ncbi:hypothetical protein SKAU_G00077870 [Synaphobranchus kaupii]|uniref:Reverse transcriptase zinc-binding domain-containing protein n=1 Tax=Synaphobranchus kaupii TaxID=118154 RepID=A0A9Q1J4W4_SYNKA|nr:hypothetical protein SKAU_G00077870 [Synaphobranchus kaupii]
MYARVINRAESVECTNAPNVKVRTGRKWNAQAEVTRAVGRLQHQELVGRVQAGRAGLGWGEAPRFWSKANQKERKAMVVAEVTRMEEECYKIKAVSQGRQGSWTTWDKVVDRKISWSDLIPQARLSFLIRSTYDMLPCPRNLHQWFGNEECCSLCNAPNASLQHLLSGCKTALSQGCYRWRHDQVLRKLAEERNLRVDLGRQLQFPGEITTTSLRPDIVVWSTKAKAVLLIELTVPWEKGIEAAFERKKTTQWRLDAEASWGCQPHTC